MKQSRSWRALLVLVVVGLLLCGDLGPVTDAEAYPEQPKQTEPGWNTLDRSSDQLLARRRRRRRRRAPRRRRPPTKKVQPAAETPAAATQAPPSSPAPAPGNLRRGSRVEFDGRLVQGQTAKSGAIYLFARKRSELRSMVKERKNYRKEILRTVYPSYRK